jgi:hypothetical protein
VLVVRDRGAKAERRIATRPQIVSYENIAAGEFLPR